MFRSLPLVVFAGVVAAAQTPVPRPTNPSDLAAPMDFEARRVSSNNPDPESNDDSWRPIAGETVVLADLDGPGVITHIWLTVAANEYAWPRLLRLRVYYDGASTPSVDCPVGDFFGVSHGLERAIDSAMVRDSSSGRSRNSYWPMPFARHVRVTVTNEGRRRVSNLYFHVDWKKVRALAPGTMYLHARYRQTLPAPTGAPYGIASIRGRGHYVGTVLGVVQSASGWFGEGDERFYVDGASRPSIEGTGTEDYFNDAWSFRVATGLYTGVPVADGTGVGARMGAYRWHVPDPIPFRTSLRLTIEHRGWTYNPDGTVRSAFEERPDLMSSVAFWYQAGIAMDQPEVPYGSRRLPLGNAQQLEAEDRASESTAKGGVISIEKDVFWSKDVLMFAARGQGSSVTVPFDVQQEGRYEIIAELAHGPEYGIYTTELDGQPTASATALEHEPGANTGDAGAIDTYFTDTYVAEDHVIGWAGLTTGRHTLTFVCDGKNPLARGYNLGIDTLVLARPFAPLPSGDAVTRSAGLRRIGERRTASVPESAALVDALHDPSDEVREAAAWALTQTTTPLAIDALTRALSDADHVVRGLAALSLRQRGEKAAPARDALLSRLGDSEIGVRMIAAQAIGRLHDASTIDPMLEACRAEGQPVHVLRSLADALGELGPEATRALPALNDLARIPRVEWAARAAIRRIEASPAAARPVSARSPARKPPQP